MTAKLREDLQRATSGCARCGRRLYYHERVAHPQTYCRPCARELGLQRICDRARPACEDPRCELDRGHDGEHVALADRGETVVKWARAETR